MRGRRAYRHAGLIMAPSITTPALTYFQSATSSLSLVTPNLGGVSTTFQSCQSLAMGAVSAVIGPSIWRMPDYSSATGDARWRGVRPERDLQKPGVVESLHQGFQRGRQPIDVEATFRWLDQIDRNPLAQEIKGRMLDLCPVRNGHHVLDVGCGLGHELLRLARLVGPQGIVVGIDANPSMIAEAQRRAAGETFGICLEVGDAQYLAFPDNSFDLCRTERVLRYLESPEAALAEMTRVVRPGGCVLAFDFDSDQTVVDAPDSTLARQIAELLDSAVPRPWIGRLGATGFGIYRQLNQDTIARAMQAGQITPAEVAAWWTALEHAAEAEAF